MVQQKQPNHSSPALAIHLFFRGFQLISVPGIRKFVIIPLCVNVILFSAAFSYLIVKLQQWFAIMDDWLPSWLNWLEWLLWPLAIISIVVAFSFIFAAVANWLAAPFNGMLAEKVEQYLTGEPLTDNGWLDLIKDLPRLLLREWKKLLYYLPRALLCLVFFFIPLFGQTLAPFVWFIFSAWMMAIQYLDYPFDNHKIPFSTMRQALAGRFTESMSFGIMAMLFTMIPVVNLLVMPVAICGATALWVENYRPQLRTR